MKLNLSSLAFALFIAVPFLLSGQSNTATSSAPAGTTLGSNDTIAYEGIALTNRVKLRGYVDFIYGYGDLDEIVDDSRFSTAADMDFLFDFSQWRVKSIFALPIRMELSWNRPMPAIASIRTSIFLSAVSLQVYRTRRMKHLDYLRSPKDILWMLSVSTMPCSQPMEGLHLLSINQRQLYLLRCLRCFFSGVCNPTARRNYVDGVRGNFNNGMVGITLGLHDGYWLSDHFNDNAAIDVAASVMIIPGLEARLGYAHQDCDSTSIDDIGHVNAWIEFNPGDLTLALEYDHFDFGDDSDSDLWDIMFLLNYQFVDWFGATLRYSHEDFEDIAGLLDLDYESDRITLAFLFFDHQQFGTQF